MIDAASLHIGQDLCTAYKTLKSGTFNEYIMKIRTQLSALSHKNNNSAACAIPATFPDIQLLSTSLTPVVSSDGELCILQTSSYTRFAPLSISKILSGVLISHSSQAILHGNIRKGMVLRLLLDHRDEPITSVPNMLWEVKHFVSIVFHRFIYLSLY